SDSSARTGGSSIDPKSSTSKIFADAGIPTHLLKGLNATTPEDALAKLIANRSSNSNTKGNSASSEQTVKSQVEQDAMDLRFKKDFIKGNILEMVEKDPNIVFGLKAFLGRLQTTRTNEALLLLVNQAEKHLDQFAKDFQKRGPTMQRLEKHKSRLMLSFGLKLISVKPMSMK
ncbi:hypothetical protein A2U01_0028740, partial [Trifolium medium]|nr:hypothetical protein [Trifolium medium]